MPPQTLWHFTSHIWNSLPVHLRDEDISYNSFRPELKNFGFNVASGHNATSQLTALYKYSY